MKGEKRRKSSSKYTPAAIAARNRYNEKAYDRVTFMIPKGGKDRLKAAARAAGQSMSAYMLEALRKRTEAEGVIL